uniref:GIY-YIG nuclease family protein n=1 Tax=Nonomuraea sp. CA-251285 TaxID=3240002 RepID=UPI003F496332
MSDSHVYVLGSPGSPRVKIGYTSDLPARLTTIQSMSPVPLAILWTHPGGRELEACLHQYFATQRRHSEWFDFGTEDPVHHVREAVKTRAWLRPRRAALRPGKPLTADPELTGDENDFLRYVHARHGKGLFRPEVAAKEFGISVAELEPILQGLTKQYCLTRYGYNDEVHLAPSRRVMLYGVPE